MRCPPTKHQNWTRWSYQHLDNLDTIKDIFNISTSSSCLNPWIFLVSSQLFKLENEANMGELCESYHREAVLSPAKAVISPLFTSKIVIAMVKYWNMRILHQLHEKSGSNLAICHSEHDEDWGSTCHVRFRPSHCSRCRYKLRKPRQCLGEIHVTNCHVDSFKSLVIWFKDWSKFQVFCNRWDRSSPEPLKSSKANFSQTKIIVKCVCKAQWTQGSFHGRNLA